MHRVCAVTGAPMPEVQIVEALQGNNDFTAGVQFRRGQPIINVPLRVVRDYPPKALTFLLAHEVGHVVSGNTFYPQKWAVGVLALLFGSGALGAVGFGAYFAYNDRTGPWLGIVAALIIAFVSCIAGVCAVMRADERRADRFAVDFLGDVEGAEQWNALVERERGQRATLGLFSRALIKLFAMHPPQNVRMEAMRRQNADFRTTGFSDA
nr:M48 family metalloprotease [Arthrobacter sp. H5]